MLPIRPGLSRQLSAAAMQVPMISSPLKQTNEIDWIQPIKSYIRSQYGDDPERYNDECGQLNRLRQDMRGAGKDSAAGRDLLYRYYGQLELLDLRFPVDENHIKISFTWFDAFTHKPTSQYSLAYEKASIIFNISAVLSCHAANQNRHEDTGLKTAYHSFQASAGMFTYINENFLHAPSTDLSRETVKTLIHIMLAQGQEVFIEKQVVDKKKPGLIAKLAAQAAYLYAQAVEGVQDNVSRAIFERVWLLMVQIKQHHIASVAQYYQAVADYEANSYGQAIARLNAAMTATKESTRLANAFPSSMPANSNLNSETGQILVDMTKKQSASITELLAEYNRDNDMIYHQPVPSETNLPSIPKLPAAKAIPVSELYQGQDIQRIIGPDIFQRIVPMSVTESASLYDEEKAKMVRAEAERVDTADDELATSLDYLKLPGSLNILKGAADQDSMSVDEEFRDWCADLAGHSPFGPVFDRLRDDKQNIMSTLDSSMKQLDMEESVCEKMRSKYGSDWTQQPSSRLTQTLRTDARSYRAAVEEASTSDAQLYSTFRQHESDLDEMRSAGETDEADVLYQRAMTKAGAGKRGVTSPGAGEEGNLLDDDFADDSRQSVAEQIERVEGLISKLQLVKRERAQVLKDLKEKIHNDDISNVLILNKKAITNQESQLFKSELEKFRPHQNRILQAVHKQSSLMKELTRTYSELLQDKRVRGEQNKYEAFSRQRNSVLSKYKKVYQAYKDLQAGLSRAEQFYSEMKETVESLQKNVQSFVENRRSEGGQLLSSIEASKGSGADREQNKMKELMERMSMSPSSHQSHSPVPSYGDQRNSGQRPPPLHQPQHSYGSQSAYNPAASPPVTPRYQANGMQSPAPYPSYQQQQPQQQQHQAPTSNYNPNQYGAMSPPAHQQYFSPPPNQQYNNYQQPSTTYYGQQPQQQYGGQSMPAGWQPPPPPPGPPPNQDYRAMQSGQYPSGPGGYAQNARQGAANGSGDPWAGLSAWK
ncbi:Vacuolar protein-sorting protein bro1 [Fulvia fulva]|uniref:BRO domain-containing protein 1 n=1 Tax=Passalora fulva TaxID=5499 RepID=A0A9Q8LDI7_PASFU|nr:Vacuolar protein-sorting protein bro1 [Fulvia fulva]KAK4629512.1 Vacuolar protein-sorting protein bro1 [Fulvia fulva]KAK4630756.1 Vacuolar protein-sorting protein bro1 [Fulvia fulva]UJO15234.1 Vacuolar protein-sorting protein bro1 [Fulvia fulva]WPV12167.1 Vacuolar protein-sorting protein bro1 [Fulvia fulva]WPV27875.1 Vacuolar protein-sorting protein bro1 [Fulvia fulva]